jgi:glyoxylase-like metal-dependent hydrolase (beta-lactamase superfamily II)
MCVEMLNRKLSDHLYMIDLKPLGFENLIASYVLKGEKASAIIEAGPSCSVKNLLAGLREIGVTNEAIDYIMVTHVHIDHAGGAGTLIKHLPNAKLVVHSRGAPHTINPEKLWEQSKLVLGKVALGYGEIEAVPENRIIMPSDGETFHLGGSVQLKVVETLGHSSHHLGFFESQNQGVFQGDAAGIYIPQLGVTIPSTPTPLYLEQTLASLEKLAKLQPKRLYYTHYGPVEKADERVRRCEEQLRLWGRIVSEALEKGDETQSIYAQILEKDPQMKDATEFIGNHWILRQGVVMQSVQGFINYYKKK